MWNMNIKIGYGIFNCAEETYKDLKKMLSSEQFKEFLKKWIAKKSMKPFNETFFEIINFLSRYRLISDDELRFPVLNRDNSIEFLAETQKLALLVLPEFISFLENYSKVERVIVALGELDSTLDLAIIESGIKPIKITNAEIFLWALQKKKEKKYYSIKISESNGTYNVKISVGIPLRKLKLTRIEDKLTYKHVKIREFAKNFVCVTKRRALKMTSNLNLNLEKTNCYVYGFIKTVYDNCIELLICKSVLPKNIAVEYGVRIG